MNEKLRPKVYNQTWNNKSDLFDMVILKSKLKNEKLKLGLRQQYKSERDSELDRAIEKLEAEVIRGRAEVEKEFQDRIR